ncbi:MAG TPA: hypothetical protein DCY31_01295 [Ruminococcaceae bacterium]|nr:hypothetical protein [Oscillospiraceae bacterium]
MKVVFISNFINHHQLPFSEEMIRLIGDGYRFIATEPIAQERLDLGYEDMNHKYDFVVCTYDGEEQNRLAQKLIDDADIVIQGGASTELIKNRLENTDKITFRYSERLFKQGYIHLLDPRVLKNSYNRYTKYSKKNFYLLCAGGYVAGDFKIIRAYPNKMFKWGYFPEIIKYEDIDKLISEKEPNSLMWAGRFIDWKHSEHAIEMAKKLKKDRVQFKLTMVGTGPLLSQTKDEVSKSGLDDCVKFTGALSPDEVRRLMEKSSIYLFTSDYNEGWGAVLNEAMNSGCAVLANHAIGAVPFMMTDGVNGRIYKNGKLDKMYSILHSMIDNPELCKNYGKEAYKNVSESWTPQEAAKRLVSLSEALLNGKDAKSLYCSGPCSVAVPIAQSKQYKQIKGAF